MYFNIDLFYAFFIYLLLIVYAVVFDQLSRCLQVAGHGAFVDLVCVTLTSRVLLSPCRASISISSDPAPVAPPTCISLFYIDQLISHCIMFIINDNYNSEFIVICCHSLQCKFIINFYSEYLCKCALFYKFIFGKILFKN